MPWSDRALLVESLGMLAFARILIRGSRGPSLIARIGGARMDGQPPNADDTNTMPAAPARGAAAAPGSSQAVRIGAMLERVARVTWWRSMCLEKALAGKWMLRRRRIPSTMYVGMARRGEEFVAHAWLVGEGQTLTGASQKAYATLAAFHEPGL